MFPNLHNKDVENDQTVINGRTILDEIDKSVVIYSGIFKIIDSSSVMLFEGVLEYTWYPNPGVSFTAKPVPGQHKLEFFFSVIELYIEEQLVGKGRFTDIFGEHVKGRLSDAVFGDKKKPIDKFLFSIPNLREINGLVAEGKDGSRFFGRRIFLEDDVFSIEILRLDDSDVNNLNSLINKGGGYYITYIGEVRPKGKHINLKKLDVHLACLDYFLSFLNGQRISVIFGKGVRQQSINWTEYASARIDPYIDLPSWAPTSTSTDFNDSWKKFLGFWKTDEKLLIYGLHWYFEANRNSGLLEGSLILSQTALETFCNWIVLEKLGIVKGSEAKSLSAANKIRILLGVLGVDSKIPAQLKSLIAVKQPDRPKITFTDGPEALTEIRNMLTHGSTSKYKNYNELDLKAVREAKQLCLWYVEIALLFCFGYKEKYSNRITKRHEYPPFLNRPLSL